MRISRGLKYRLKALAKRVVPRRYWRRQFRSLAAMTARDAELLLLRRFCDSQKTSIDIGAAGGLFSVGMLGHSRDVIAFEPRPAQAKDLLAMFDAVGAPVRVEAVALSDHAGTSKMRILISDPGRSTIEEDNPLADEDGSSRAEIAVTVRRLDDYELESVGFLKIDVEGHELAVLRGASATLEKNRPTLLIEAEERHRKNAVADIASFLKPIGYDGYYLLDGQLHSMEEFDKESLQDDRNIGGWKEGWALRGTYVNSFLFVPSQDAELAIRDEGKTGLGS